MRPSNGCIILDCSSKVIVVVVVGAVVVVVLASLELPSALVGEMILVVDGNIIISPAMAASKLQHGVDVL
jgi:hypothetical protein